VSLSLAMLGYFLLFIVSIFVSQQTKNFISRLPNLLSPPRRVSIKANLLSASLLMEKQKPIPIQLIGYHHQVMDTIGNEPVIITYCTVCRTGRVYSSR
jgi:hypothetical protein